jgi:hypothetical protein
MSKLCTNEILWANADVQCFKYAYIRLFISDELRQIYSNIFDAIDEPWQCLGVYSKTKFDSCIKLWVIYTNLTMDDIVFNMKLRDRSRFDYLYYQIADRDD